MFGVMLLAAGLGAFVIVVSGSGFGTLVLCFVFWMVAACGVVGAVSCWFGFALDCVLFLVVWFMVGW